MEIRDGDFADPQVIALLRRHLAGMHEHSPPESVHALDLSGLQRPDVSFWTAWDGDALLGCGALKQLDGAHGEIKSMRTADTALRMGVGAALLTHILAAARERGLTRLSLETGSGPAFEPATALYRRFGFEACGSFGDYPRDDPFSRFMTIALE
jgi:putative acetyltransferase